MMEDDKETRPTNVLDVDEKADTPIVPSSECSKIDKNDQNTATTMDITIEDQTCGNAILETRKNNMDDECVLETNLETCPEILSIEVVSSEKDINVEYMDEGNCVDNILETSIETSSVVMLAKEIDMANKQMDMNTDSEISTANDDVVNKKDIDYPVESNVPDVNNSTEVAIVDDMSDKTDENNELKESNTLCTPNEPINKDVEHPDTINAITTNPVEIIEKTVQTNNGENESENNTQAEENTSVEKHKSGLGLLAAQYGDVKSDSEDSVVETINEYREMVVEIDSDTSSDSDLEEVEVDPQRNDLKKLINLAADDEYDEDDENNGKPRKPPKVKGELLLEDLPPIQDLQITVPEEECIELGKIFSIVDQLVLVKPYPNAILVNLDTVLFLEKGKKVLGEVFDVLGQVADPIYCIRFNSNKQIKDKEIEINQLVYAAPKTEHTQFIILSNLMNVRGSDASWENDIEPPNKYLDYSDDEEEREARRSMRNKDRPIDYVDLTKKSRPDIPTNSGGRRPRQSYDRNINRRQNNYSSQQGRNFYPRDNRYQQPSSASHSWHTSNYCNNNQQYFSPAQDQQYQNLPNMVYNPYAIRPPQLNPQNFMPGPSFPSYLNRPPPPPPQ